MTDSFPKARRAKPPRGSATPPLPFRWIRQIRRDEVLGPERSSWPSLFQTSPDISNAPWPAQDQAEPRLSQFRQINGNGPGWAALRGESFPLRPAILAVINMFDGLHRSCRGVEHTASMII